MSDALHTRVARALDTAVVDSMTLDGGEIGTVSRLDLADGRTVVAKAAEGGTPPAVEARMLADLERAGLPVPTVVHADDDCLVLDYIAGDGAFDEAAERDVARHLARLHDTTAARYGYPTPTWSGRHRRTNPRLGDWPTFFRETRLRPIAADAHADGVLPDALHERVCTLADDVDTLLPSSPPASLVHGDAWANNVVVRDGTVAAFLDPACAYVHAEYELAYCRFAGFSEAFFDAYEAHRAIDPGFAERSHCYVLVPLLDHLWHFGADRYVAGVRDALDALGY
ncbi:fructosamine kinase family protein [Halarchaeum sp. P4]|uniref:fructosamine kinase family protein n=1 Tax=Halarchaeum sp. P4 TaxID=3421639 RepID=UPI003EB70E43